jgi:beta-glucuronidase
MKRRACLFPIILFSCFAASAGSRLESAQSFPESFGLVQNTKARQFVSLNGEWHTIVDPYETGFYGYRYEERSNGYFKNAQKRHPSDLIEYDFSKSPTLMVPGDWNSQDDRLFFYEGTVWYYRDFNLKKSEAKRYLLHFGAVNYQAVVYVNGEKAGGHEGGFTPFQFDVGDYVKNGENFIVVKADNRRERDQVPTVNTDWWNYGGITRPVRLLELERTYVADYRIQLDKDSTEKICGWIEIGGDQRSDYGEAHISIPELKARQTVRFGDKARAEFAFAAKPELWSPESPKLYDVEWTYGGETIRDRIGFRTVEVEGQNILLNGKPLFLRGISIHEEAPARDGRAWSEEDARTTLGWAKDLGCNFVRLAHYPHNEAMLKTADEMGLLVWSEIPVYWTVQFDSAQVYAKAEQQLTEMIGRDKNRASIILWSVANETPAHETRFEFLKKLAEKARALDASRLITAALESRVSKDGARIIDDPFAGIVDVIGINSYCGWYGRTPESCARLRWRSPYNKPVIISEFGGGALRGKHGEEFERWTEEYQAAVYRHNITMIENMPFAKGTTPWILKDFRSPRRPLPGIQDYWNRKGLVSEKGERKLAWKVLHDFYQRIKSGEAR